MYYLITPSGNAYGDSFGAATFSVYISVSFYVTVTVYVSVSVSVSIYISVNASGSDCDYGAGDGASICAGTGYLCETNITNNN